MNYYNELNHIAIAEDWQITDAQCLKRLEHHYGHLHSFQAQLDCVFEYGVSQKVTTLSLGHTLDVCTQEVQDIQAEIDRHKEAIGTLLEEERLRKLHALMIEELKQRLCSHSPAGVAGDQPHEDLCADNVCESNNDGEHTNDISCKSKDDVNIAAFDTVADAIGGDSHECDAPSDTEISSPFTSSLCSLSESSLSFSRSISIDTYSSSNDVDDDNNNHDVEEGNDNGHCTLTHHYGSYYPEPGFCLDHSAGIDGDTDSELMDAVVEAELIYVCDDANTDGTLKIGQPCIITFSGLGIDDDCAKPSSGISGSKDGAVKDADDSIHTGSVKTGFARGLKRDLCAFVRAVKRMIVCHCE